ncbi:hypothetical protein [Achromobacter aloeverae]
MMVIDAKLHEAKCPAGSRARHPQLGDVDVLEVRDVHRLVLAVEWIDGELVRSTHELHAADLFPVSPTDDLQPTIAPRLATILPFRANAQSQH